MNLRSGKTLLPTPPPEKVRFRFQVADCFGNTWPSLEEARDMSISTDNPDHFHTFCMGMINNVNNVADNRLCFLAITESFFRCGQPVLKKYFNVILSSYQKLRDAFQIQTPRDMKQYLVKLNDLMFRVAYED
jgi:hypothetical protein